MAEMEKVKHLLHTIAYLHQIPEETLPGSYREKRTSLMMESINGIETATNTFADIMKANIQKSSPTHLSQFGVEMRHDNIPAAMVPRFIRSIRKELKEMGHQLEAFHKHIFTSDTSSCSVTVDENEKPSYTSERIDPRWHSLLGSIASLEIYQNRNRERGEGKYPSLSPSMSQSSSSSSPPSSVTPLSSSSESSITEHSVRSFRLIDNSDCESICGDVKLVWSGVLEPSHGGSGVQHRSEVFSDQINCDRVVPFNQDINEVPAAIPALISTSSAERSSGTGPVLPFEETLVQDISDLQYEQYAQPTNYTNTMTHNGSTQIADAEPMPIETTDGAGRADKKGSTEIGTQLNNNNNPVAKSVVARLLEYGPVRQRTRGRRAIVLKEFVPERHDEMHLEFSDKVRILWGPDGLDRWYGSRKRGSPLGTKVYGYFSKDCVNGISQNGNWQ